MLISLVSAGAEAVLEQVRKLPRSEQQQILQALLRLLRGPTLENQKTFQTVKVGGGVITSEQVAEAG